MSKITDRLNAWYDEGVIVSKMDFAKRIEGSKSPYAEVNRMLHSGRMFRTSVEGIMFTNIDERNKFECLLRAGRILTYNALAMRYDEGLTYYGAKKMVASGQFECFDKLGKSALLFVPAGVEKVSPSCNVEKGGQ
jgi:hypothetical protein